MALPGAQLGLRFFMLTGLLVIGCFFVMQREMQHVVNAGIDATGEAIARQLAISVRDNVINRELLALHAQAAALQETPIVMSVSIFDANDTLLVRSPAVNNTENTDKQYAYPSPITLNDTLIGNVHVRLDTRQLTNLYQHIYSTLIGLLIIGLCGCLWLATRYTNRLNRIFVSLGKQMDAIIHLGEDETLYPGNDPDSWLEILGKKLDILSRQTEALRKSSPLHQKPIHTSGNAHALPAGYGLLIIECLNINQIQRQISHRQTKKILAQFQQAVDHCALLYGGKHLATHGKYLLLRFEDDENHDAPSRLVFCSWLIMASVMNLQENAELGLHVKCRMSGRWSTTQPERTRLENNLYLQHELDDLHQLCQQGAENDLILGKNFRQFEAIVEHCKLKLISNHELDEDFYLLEGMEDNILQTLNMQLDTMHNSQR